MDAEQWVVEMTVKSPEEVARVFEAARAVHAAMLASSLGPSRNEVVKDEALRSGPVEIDYL